MHGEENALVALYEGIWRNRFIVLAHGRTMASCEDQAQEVFLTAWRAILSGTLVEPRCLWAFVATIRRYIKLQAIRARVYQMLNAATPAPERTDDLALKHERHARLTRVLDRLRARERKSLADDRSPLVVAAEMGLTIQQFRLLRSRALKRLLVAA